MNGRITTEHTVWCLYCPEFEKQPEATKRGMERVAKACGWRKQKGKWVCPRCVAERRRAFFDRTTDVPQGQGMQ